MGSKPSKSPPLPPNETMFSLLQAYIALRLAREEAKMGRTIPSYCVMLEEELKRWEEFRDFL